MARKADSQLMLSTIFSSMDKWDDDIKMLMYKTIEAQEWAVSANMRDAEIFKYKLAKSRYENEQLQKRIDELEAKLAEHKIDIEPVEELKYHRVYYILSTIKGSPKKAKGLISKPIFDDVKKYHAQFEDKLLEACQDRYGTQSLSVEKAIELLESEVVKK